MLSGILFFAGCKETPKEKKVVLENGSRISCAATEEALRAAIEMSRTMTGAKTICIENGVVALSSPVILDGRDRELTLRGSGGTVFSGGVELIFHEVENERYWSARLPENLPEPYLLFVPGSGKRERAVFPKTGWLKNLDKSDLVWLGRQSGGWNRPPTEYELTRMSVTPDDLPDFEPADADVEVAHNREVSIVHIKSYDPNLWEMVFASPLTHPAGASLRKEYRIHNIEQGMAPGKWRYHRATREIYYFPQSGEIPGNFRAVAAVTEPLLKIQSGEKIKLENIEFFCANADLRRRGAICGETSGRALPAVEIAGSSDISLSGVTVRFVAGTAIEISRGNRITVEKSRMHDVGAFGIWSENVRDLTVRDNVFAQIGQIAVLTKGENAAILDNEITQVASCGVFAVGNAKISGNRIRQVMLQRNDGAAVYLGGGKNAEISGNQIHDLPAEGSRHAVYIDETTENVKIGNNTIGSSSPLMVNRAGNILVSGNTFTAQKEMTFDLVDSDCVTLRKNVIRAPEIVFSAPENALKKAENSISGVVRENVKPRGFIFYYDQQNVLRCKTDLNDRRLEPLKWKKIVLMGASIMAAGTFGYELQLYLACRFPARRIEVVNAGVSGTTAAWGWEHLTDILALEPDAVILGYGMNDIGRNDYRTLWPESVDQTKRRRYGIESYQTSVKKIVGALQQRGIDVVLLPPFPYDEYGTRPAPDDNLAFCNSIGLEKLASFCYREYDGKLPLPMTRTALCRLYAHYPELRIAPDRIHPDARGHWLIADEIVHELFDRFPAEDPLPFPLTAEMAEFSRLPRASGVGEEAQLHPLQYLGKNGALDAPTQILREKLAKVASLEGILNTTHWFDMQARDRGVDPGDFDKADEVLRPLAMKWGLPKTYEKYRQWRMRREEIAAEAEKAREDFFRTVDELHRKK